MSSLAEHMRPTDAERRLIGAILSDADAVFDDVIRTLPHGASDFYHHAHGVVYAACLDLWGRKISIGVDTVWSALVQSGRAQELGVDRSDQASWLAETLTQSGGGGAIYYANQVREASLRRRLFHAAHQFVSEAESLPVGSADEQVGRWEIELRGIADAATESHDPPCLPQLVAKALAELDERQANGVAAGHQTGFNDLDILLGGLRPGQLVVLGARPGSGKTALALAFLVALCRNNGVPAYFSSLEMPNTEIVHRLLAMATGVSLHRITRAKLNMQDAEALAGAVRPNVYGQTKLYIDDSPHANTLRLHAQTRRMVRRYGVQMLAVDYLQLLQPADPRENRVQQVGKMTRELKLVARDCNIPVLLLSQLNRQSEDRGDTRPKLSDLRESGSIEQDADAVILLHVPPGQGDELECWRVNAIVAKNRNGPTGEVPLVFRRPVVRFESAAWDGRAA